MGSNITISSSLTTGMRVSPIGIGGMTLSGKSPYPKYYDISGNDIWSYTSWTHDGPARVSIVQDEALFNDYAPSGSFVSLDVSDGGLNWANNLTSSGYEQILTADASLEKYYWGDGFGAGYMGRNDASTLASDWKILAAADIIDIKLDKSGSYLYTLEGFGSSGFPAQKWTIDGSLLWTTPRGIGNAGMDIDLDEDYIAVGGGYNITKILSDGSINWQYDFPGYTTGISTYTPSIDGTNNVYGIMINTNLASRPSYLVKLNENGVEQWMVEVATEDASGNYGTRKYSRLAKDGNIWVIGTEAVGVNNPPFTGFMYKYRAKDGILMERYQLSTPSNARLDNFDMVEGTNETVVVFSGIDSAKKFKLEG